MTSHYAKIVSTSVCNSILAMVTSMASSHLKLKKTRYTVYVMLLSHYKRDAVKILTREKCVFLKPVIDSQVL